MTSKTKKQKNKSKDNSKVIQKPKVEVAGLLLRLAAMFYDGFLLTAMWFLIAGTMVIINGGEELPLWASQFLLLPTLILATLIFNVWFWTHGGQSLGMRAWRIKVVDLSGKPITPQSGIKRCAFSVISLAALGLGYIWMLFDKEKRTWHDRWSETCVVHIPKKKKKKA